MSNTRRRFRPSLAISIIALCSLAVFVSMGTWQVRRGQQKLDLQQRLDERSRAPAILLTQQLLPLEQTEYARVTARGVFLPERTLFQDNRTHNGTVGYEVLTPLRIEGGEVCVLVDRGWVAAGASRAELPRIKTPAGTVTVEGIAAPPKRFFELAQVTPSGPVWQNITVERVQAATGLSLQPFLLRQTSEADDGLTHVEERPDTGVSTHQGYAFQWFTFAALVVILYFALNFKRIEHAEANSTTEEKSSTDQT